MPRNLTRGRIVLAVVAAAVVGGAAGAAVVSLTRSSPRTTVQTVEVQTPTTTNVAASGRQLSVNAIYRSTVEGIVEIDSQTTTAGSAFPGSSTQATAEGTGFVYDKKGDIVTNYHVISGASSTTVKLDDGSTYKATVVGTDPSTDLAVIHIAAPASKLFPLTLGDSSTAAVGDGVVAIGDPFGLDDTVTSGIVSAVNREITAPNGMLIEGAIQTDAAINHGNSGGPLLNLSGQVIGINSQIQSDSGGNDGVGFALPSNTVKQFVPELIANGKAAHALLGVDPATASGGVKVSKVEAGTGAAKAGLKVGDVITAVDGAAVTSSQQLRRVIDERAPGQKLTLTVDRSGKTITVTVTLGTRPNTKMGDR